MNKALEMVRTMINGANEYEKKTGDKNPPVYFSKDNLLIIEQALHRLESIDNAKPSEALVCLEYIENKLRGLRVECERIKNHRCDDVFIQEHTFDTIKQALLKAQEPKQYVDELKLVEKKLKALEIIKEKRVDIEKIIFYGNVEDYNNSNVYKTLTTEEYETIKEVIE